MADTVQSFMERMIPELDDLQDKGLFSRAEVRALVKRRRKFEYLLNNRQVDKGDYLDYITFEINVEALRRRRKERAGLQKASSGISCRRRIRKAAGCAHSHSTRSRRTEPSSRRAGRSPSRAASARR